MFAYNDLSANSKRFKFSYDSTSGKYGTTIDSVFYPFGESGTDISDTTATAGTVLSGYYFYTSDGTKTEGSVRINNATNITVVGNKTYQSGYYPSNWTVTSGGVDTSDATAAAKNIEFGYSAYVKGVKINGIASIQHGTIIEKRAVENLIGEGVGRWAAAGTHIGNYALIAGGAGNAQGFSDVDTYNASLTKSTAANLNTPKYYLKGSHNSNYAIFAGGYRRNGSGGDIKIVDAYSTSLVHSNPQSLSSNTQEIFATHIGNYALFGGGYTSTAYNPLDTVNAYNNSLTYSSVTLSAARAHLGATHNQNYAIFAGGYKSDNQYFNTVDAFDSSLTRTITSINRARYYLSGAHIGEYALFGGGYYNGTYYSTIDCFNSSLTLSSKALSTSKIEACTTHTLNYALFGGGGTNASSVSNTIDGFTTSLTRISVIPLTENKANIATTNINNYAIFAGGSYGTIPYSVTVDVFYES